MRFIHLFLRNREACEVAIQLGVIIMILVNLIFRVLIWFRWKKKQLLCKYEARSLSL